MGYAAGCPRAVPGKALVLTAAGRAALSTASAEGETGGPCAGDCGDPLPLPHLPPAEVSTIQKEEGKKNENITSSEKSLVQGQCGVPEEGGEEATAPPQLLGLGAPHAECESNRQGDMGLPESLAVQYSPGRRSPGIVQLSQLLGKKQAITTYNQGFRYFLK